MRHITLLTDFGESEGEHTVMKGVIWRILPGAHIADISHIVEPQNIQQAAIILERVAHFFPDETVHVVVVDPGVGTERRPIAAQFGNQFFVGPDNGVCTPLLERAEQAGEKVEIVHLDQPRYWLDDVTAIFHGRDIFSPAGAHLASGVPLTEMGTLVTDVIRFHLPKPVVHEKEIVGEVIHIDHFGNILTNIPRAILEPKRPVQVALNGITINGMINTFGERPVGSLVALYSPHYQLMVSVVNGNAASRLETAVGDRVVVTSR
jgi:S-adenosylmethionine hydrolase